ncbi:hypothetical protein ACP0H4_11285 [Pseudomonas aeruginosa]|uniref:hypothetical protein n=1 Tax=Pseudomonas aeruginosa TaxID=287 RepID=UPI001F0595E1|nr:hypothetical protein [Pseudomonas aeruginosa]MCH0754246.1 hypothetical protein [Pseudomonas aeruginosa]MCO2058744.1 hypothetical protein [Pseudomonas aeruginosa]
MSIDWSKAPEGATHYHHKLSHPWLKDGDIPMYFYPPFWMKYCRPEEGKALIEYAVPRPGSTTTVWDGQGLPPVGITCESWRSGVRRIVKILGHGDEYIFVREDDGREILLSIGDGREFRPRRTPEQIAAEERSKECDRIFAILSSVEREGNRSDMAEAIYDAGYRRQEEGK